MSNFIHARYDLKKVTLDGQVAVFVYPKEELESVNVVKKHIDRISVSSRIIPVNEEERIFRTE